MYANYWAHCRGERGTKAVYKGFFSDWDARLGAESNWKWEHPNERIVRIFVDCVETDYDSRPLRAR